MNELDKVLPFGLTADGLLLILLSGVAFITVLAVWYGLIERHPMERRARILADRRAELRGQALKERGPRRRQQESLSIMRRVVVMLKLLQSQQSSKLNARLAQAGLRSRDAAIVFLFFKVAAPVLLGAAAFFLVYLLEVGNLAPATRLCVVLASAGLGHLMLHAKARTDTPRMFAALIVLAAIGILLYLVADRLLRRAVPWHAESNPAED